jgi:signal transduction histidine kinase
VEIGPIALTEAVRGAEEMVRMAVPKTIAMNWRIEAEDMTVRADSTQVTQVLINLARNSADAMGDTGGTIEIALERVRRDGAASEWEAALSVRDDGCGMDEEIQARIFDPFFTTKEVGAGTGLGLSVVHGIAKSWGGTISVNSRVGEGTLVTIRLPLLQSAEEGAPAE